MKRILVLLVLSLFLIHSGIRTYYFVSWKIYQTEITEKYCINKDRPEMHCNGQCYLSKQLKALENEYESSKTPFPPINGKVVDILLFCPVQANFQLPSTYVSATEQSCFSYAINYSSQYLDRILDPPKLLSEQI